MSRAAGSSSGREAVNWDDQVVPALRRRLESESAYLSNRMSTASFPSVNGFEMSQTDAPTLKRENSARARTKSSHVHALASSTGTPYRPALSQVQVQAPHSAPRPSRIPMRPRSKSNLGARPDPPSPPTEEVPRMPSAIPRLIRGESGESGSRNGRESPDMMMASSISNDDLKDELPPFRLRKGEAMRIAEKGHDLRDTEEADEEVYDYGRGEDSLDGAKRRRRQSMRSVSKNNVKLDVVPPLPLTSGLPRSATGNVGLGLPPTRSKALQLNAAPRSSSSRQALNHLSSSTTTPRSASLNMLAQSNSRLGIAAHLVPPESTYTPPKGQAWDEVVLPTVAKKLGLGDSPSQQGWVEEDGDLAVEWDKSGTPVKWIKKEVVGRLGGPGEASKVMQDRGLPGDDFITRQGTPSHLHPLNSSTKSAFSPSFEPSPDNPLYPRHLHPRASNTSLSPLPSPTPHRQISKEHLQPHPIRASSGQWTSMRQSPPSSPAPFSQMQPLGPAGAGPRHMNSFDNSNSNSPSRRGHSHKSSENIKMAKATDMYFSNPRPMQYQNGGVHDGQGQGQGQRHNAHSRYASPQSDGRQMDQSAWSPASVEPNRRGKKDNEGHGKGCGCVIM